VALSESDDPLRPDHSNAYVTQLTHINERSDVRAYVREQDAGFGVGQQMSSEAGTRKYGADGTFRITRDWSVRGEAFRQEMLTTGAERNLASAEVHKQSADYTFGGGARYVA